jgi:Glycosyl transferase family 2
VTPPDAPIVLCGGVVAYNERRRLGGAVRSLLTQRLPPGVVWGDVHVVVSGSTDGTDRVAAGLALADPRVHATVEPRRNGKSAALAEVFRHSRGDYLVLLNGDAEAAPGSIRALLEAAPSPDVPFAVMGRPVPRPSTADDFSPSAQLLWSVHNAFHASVLATREGNHLSDELLLLPIRHLPPMSPGIVNDGSFVGGWLTVHHGALLYAPAAVVRISAPRSVREHIRQRRRIRYGHLQIHDQLDVQPLTLERYARRHPLGTMRLVANETRRPGGVRALVTLLGSEVIALGLSAVDGASNRVDHVRWKTIVGNDPSGSSDSGRSGFSADSV